MNVVIVYTVRRPRKKVWNKLTKMATFGHSYMRMFSERPDET